MPLLLPAPPEPLLLPAPQSRFQRHPKAILFGALAVLLIVAFAVGWFLHHRREQAAEAAEQRARSAIPAVTVVPVKASSATGELLLPGSLSAIADAAIYARAAGYVKRRTVDIGDAVRQGQVLAEIDSPELDLQVAQGRAALAQARQQLAQANAEVGDARAKLALALVTLDRYRVLLAQDSIARQDVDVQQQVAESAQATLDSVLANVGAAAEVVRAQQANLERLAALQAYTKVRAPFDGIVTARGVDVGTLISGSGASLAGGDASTGMSSASTSTGGSSGGGMTSGAAGGGSGGTSSGGGIEMFRVAQMDRLRVYIDVPQESAPAVRVNGDAEVIVSTTGRRVAGRVTRTARALDPTQRTLLAEVQIDNRDGALMPGMYAQVKLAGTRGSAPLLIPSETVIARANGTQVALVAPLPEEARSRLPPSPDAQNARRIHLQPVEIGRDYGTEIEVTGGLQAGQQIVLNPGDATREGAVIVPKAAPAKDGAGGSEGGGKATGARSAGGSADAASASDVPGGASDRSAAGIQSPSMQAPTKGSERKR